MSDTIRITYYRSAIGRQKKQKDTVRALGFRRLNQTIERPDNPSVRGMVNKISHLVRIDEDEDVDARPEADHDEHEDERDVEVDSE